MRDLKKADKAGQGDLAVSHRMSSFFVFGMALAKQRGLEEPYQTAMLAMADRQRGASLEGNEIVELLDLVGSEYNGKNWTAKQWSDLLAKRVPEGHHELSEKCCRTGWVAYQFSANEAVLVDRFGMKKAPGSTPETRNRVCYRFTRLREPTAREQQQDATVDENSVI
jgi:hypothetical protein